MRPLRVAVLTVAALAVAVPSAAGKGVIGAKACGPDGCSDVARQSSMALMQGGPPTAAPPKAAPFVELRLRIGEPTADHQLEVARMTMLYVPSAGVIRGDDGTWMTPTAEALTSLEDATRGTEPWPAAELSRRAPEVPVAAPAPPRPSVAPDDGDGWLLRGILLGVLGLGAAALLAAAWRHRGAPQP